MTSPLSSDLFALNDLPKHCFLVVAEQLDNEGRRHLSQTCQRFRQLLIPDDRYSNPSPSNEEEVSINNPSISLKPTAFLETRHLVPNLYIGDEAPEDAVCIVFSYGNRSVRVKVHRDKNHQPNGLYKANDHFRDVVVGRMPEILHTTIHELSKYFVFRKTNVPIGSERFLRLSIEGSLHKCLGVTPIHIRLLLSRDDRFSDEAICELIEEFRVNMVDQSVLRFVFVEEKTVGEVERLKGLVQQTIGDIEWDQISLYGHYKEVAPLKLEKRNAKVVGKFSDEFVQLF